MFLLLAALPDILKKNEINKECVSETNTVFTVTGCKNFPLYFELKNRY